MNNKYNRVLGFWDCEDGQYDYPPSATPGGVGSPKGG